MSFMILNVNRDLALLNIINSNSNQTTLQANYCRMLNVGEHLNCAIWVRLMFTVFKFGECHVRHSFFHM